MYPPRVLHARKLRQEGKGRIFPVSIAVMVVALSFSISAGGLNGGANPGTHRIASGSSKAAAASVVASVSRGTPSSSAREVRSGPPVLSVASPMWPGAVVDTLVLLNNSLIPGNFPPGNGLMPLWAAVDRATGHVYVTDSGSGNVAMINATTDQVVDFIPVGSGPDGVAVDKANGYVYVANEASGNVTVIDGATNRAVESITVGGGPAGVAVDDANGYVYVIDLSSANITVINGATDTVVGSIPVSGELGIAVDDANGYVYVANPGAGTVTVINGSNDQVAGLINLGGSPWGIAVDPANGYVYVSNAYSDNVTAINGTTEAIVGSVPVGKHPEGVAVDEANGYVYVSNAYSNNVTVINAATDIAVGSIQVGNFPEGIAVDGANAYVYVANVGWNGYVYGTGTTSNNMTVINGATNTAVGSITMGVGPWSIAVDQMNGYVYVSNSYSDNVSVVNGATDRVVGFIPVGGLPAAIAVDDANGYVYVTNLASGSVSVIDGATDRVVGTIGVGSFPDAIAADNANGYLYVANEYSKNVSVIDGATNTVVGSIPVGYDPYGVTVDRRNGNVFVTNYWSGNVTVINGATDTAVSSISVGNHPAFVAVDDANGYVYVTSDWSGNVTIINGTTDNVVGLIPVGLFPTGVAVDDANGYVYVISDNSMFDVISGNIAVINGATNTVVGSIPVGAGPEGLAVDTASGDILVANTGSGSLSVISPAFPVRFEEHGLPPGSSWSVSVQNAALSSNTTSIDFSEPRGTNSFSVGIVPGYLAIPASGTVTVSGRSTTVNITFVPATYSVTLTEQGLPAGTVWSATLAGNGQSYSKSSTATSIVFVLPNGTYVATVDVPAGYDASLSSGTITVAGQPASATVSFSVRPPPSPLPWLLVGTLTVAALGGLLAGLHFTRISRETIFQTGVRELIVNYVVANPGASFSAVRDTLGLRNGRAAYHLGVLEKQGFLHSETKRRRHLYFPNGNAALWRDLPVSSLQDSILKAVRESPGVGVRDLGRMLRRNHTSVSYNVRALSRDGMLRTQREGLRLRCYPINDGGE